MDNLQKFIIGQFKYTHNVHSAELLNVRVWSFWHSVIDAIENVGTDWKRVGELRVGTSKKYKNVSLLMYAWLTGRKDLFERMWTPHSDLTVSLGKGSKKSWPLAAWMLNTFPRDLTRWVTVHNCQFLYKRYFEKSQTDVCHHLWFFKEEFGVGSFPKESIPSTPSLDFLVFANNTNQSHLLDESYHEMVKEQVFDKKFWWLERLADTHPDLVSSCVQQIKEDPDLTTRFKNYVGDGRCCRKLCHVAAMYGFDPCPDVTEKAKSAVAGLLNTPLPTEIVLDIVAMSGVIPGASFRRVERFVQAMIEI